MGNKCTWIYRRERESYMWNYSIGSVYICTLHIKISVVKLPLCVGVSRGLVRSNRGSCVDVLGACEAIINSEGRGLGSAAIKAPFTAEVIVLDPNNGGVKVSAEVHQAGITSEAFVVYVHVKIFNKHRGTVICEGH